MSTQSAVKAYRVLVHSAKQVVTVASKDKPCLKGSDMNNIDIVEQTGDDGVSIVVDRHGNIAAIGHDSVVRPEFESQSDCIIDATNMCIVPGLVDGHTHAVWAGDRVHEFAMKLAGATYMEIHKAGGGINFTVEHTRAASEDELYSLLRGRLFRMLAAGTTLAECKSGYGLDWDTELKMLRAMNRAGTDASVAVELSITYCAAHSVPAGCTSAQATETIVNDYLPRLAELVSHGQLRVDNVDVFCEKGVFDVAQTKVILEAGRHFVNLNANFHAEELCCQHSAEMGSQIGATAMSHLEEVSEAGIAAMADAGTVAVILPTTAYLLHLKPPPVRRMIDAGVPVALGTDFNPNAFCLSMPLVMHLACVNLGMTMKEALAAATLNAAASLSKSSTHGSLAVGKRGDFVIIDASRWEHLIYQLGGHDTVIKHVIKSGRTVFTRCLDPDGGSSNAIHA